MIVLDTNVLSELTRPRPAHAVLDWLASTDRQTLCTTSLTVAELVFGVARLPAGRRRGLLRDAVLGLLEDVCGGRVLPFDGTAAIGYAQIRARREARGLAGGDVDLMIAAIAASAGAQVATRDVADFEHSGVAVVDPWATR